MEKMIGHQTVEEWQAIVDKNRAWSKENGKRENATPIGSVREDGSIVMAKDVLERLQEE